MFCREIESTERPGFWLVMPFKGSGPLSHDGHSFLAGNGTGGAKYFHSREFAAAVAEWFNYKRTAPRYPVAETKRFYTEVRRGIANRHGVPEAARAMHP